MLWFCSLYFGGYRRGIDGAWLQPAALAVRLCAWLRLKRLYLDGAIGMEPGTGLRPEPGSIPDTVPCDIVYLNYEQGGG
jgi:hypothetical protein